MASVSLLLKENKANSKGEKPLYIRITKGRKSTFISLGIKVHPELWNQEKLRVKNQYRNSARVNALIAKKIAEVEAMVLDMEMNNISTTTEKIKDALKGKQLPSLIEYMEEYLRDLKAKGKIGTYDKVNATLLKLRTYLKGKSLNFEEFDLDFLKRYERYLRDTLGNAPNTIHSNLKIFRKVFNDAVREDIIDIKFNPFTKYRLAWVKTQKVYLTEEELRAIENVQLIEGSVIENHRNMFVFAAYVGGIRISDLLQLRWSNFDGTHIKIFTQKTKEYISIKLPSKAISTLEVYSERYPGKRNDDFIFPCLSNEIDYSSPEVLFKAISSMTAYANKNLKIIARKAGIDKNVTFHSSRHTWATRALNKGMRLEYISKLMGHGSLKTTMIYTKIVNQELDSAMSIFDIN